MANGYACMNPVYSLQKEYPVPTESLAQMYNAHLSNQAEISSILGYDCNTAFGADRYLNHLKCFDL